VRFAYADPPYLGCGEKYYGREVCSYQGGGKLGAAHPNGRTIEVHPQAAEWDDPATHQALVRRLVDEYPDGWAVSLRSRSLKLYLEQSPEDARVAVWNRGSFGGPRVGYCWEPVIFRTSAPEASRSEVFDVLTYNTGGHRNLSGQQQPGFIGAKPHRFCEWVLGLLGYVAGRDTVDDLFPGLGAMGLAADSLPFGRVELAASSDCPTIVGWPPGATKVD
jgi:hypothetical protein